MILGPGRPKHCQTEARRLDAAPCRPIYTSTSGHLNASWFYKLIATTITDDLCNRVLYTFVMRVRERL
jgi:hypothetical protein